MSNHQNIADRAILAQIHSNDSTQTCFDDARIELESKNHVKYIQLQLEMVNYNYDL